MKNVGISFSQESATICEIIVAGISAGKFHLSVIGLTIQISYSDRLSLYDI